MFRQSNELPNVLQKRRLFPIEGIFDASYNSKYKERLFMKVIRWSFALLLISSGFAYARTMNCRPIGYQGREYVYCPTSNNFYSLGGFTPESNTLSCPSNINTLDESNAKLFQDLNDAIEIQVLRIRR